VNRIRLLPLGSIPQQVLSGLAAGITAAYRLPCELLAVEPDPTFAYNVTRQQYSSTEILAEVASRCTPDGGRLLAVTPVDLYIPILTFVFGEAQLHGSAAVVSYHRLRQEFYGLPADEKILHHRLLKESVHELGHTLTLPHCDDYECVMAPSHAVEWIDLKSHGFCSECSANVVKATATSVRLP
jgi:archaemetzincin